MIKCQCGSYAINDDPERVLCDRCWRDDEIERLKAELEEAREALSREGIMRDRQGNLRRHPWLKEKE